MGLSPFMSLIGIIVVLTIGIVGVIEAPDKTADILGFCGTITTVLLLMLKQDMIQKKGEEKAEEIKTEIKSKIEAKGSEVKETVCQLGVDKSHILKSLAEDVKEVKSQRNGNLTEALNKLENKIDQKTEEVKRAINPDQPKQ